MTTEMIKRVADAQQARWAKAGPVGVEPYEMARVAIEAMREPTDTMLEKADDLADASERWPASVDDVWSTMVDVALGK